MLREVATAPRRRPGSATTISRAISAISRALRHDFPLKSVLAVIAFLRSFCGLNGGRDDLHAQGAALGEPGSS